MKKIAVSLHATESFSPNVIRNLKGLDYIHIDVMDGKFVSPINLNLDAFELVKRNYDIPIIAHLMVVDPANYIEKIIDKVYIFLFHFEIEGDRNQIIEKVHRYGKKVGIVLNPSTSIENVIEYLSKLDYVLILGVNPGYSGQKFITNTVAKVNELCKYKMKFPFLIDVDGGVNLDNAISLKNADILSSSSAILQAKDPNNIINKLKQLH